MTQPIISARGLSKRFQLGGVARHNTLRDHVTQAARSILSLRKKKDAQDDEFWALRDINFDVAIGEVVGVIGRNGAGKSTLLKILSQITEPTEGEITLRGRVASLLEVGTGFHSELTGRENIFLNGAILGMTQAEINKKFDEIVAFSEVEKFLDTPVKHYSSGMSMRLAFGVAAHLEPEILLIDEVLAVGDATFQKKCMGKMDEVAKAGRTVLFVSHNMAAMQALCTKGFFLEKGRLKRTGPINEMINLYMGEAAADAKDNQFCTEIRSGSGTVLVKNMELDCDGVKGAAVAGGRMQFTIDYEGEKENLPLQFIIGIYDSFNSRVLAVDSKVVDNLPEIFPRKGRIQITFPEDSCLSPGRYYVNIGIQLHKEMVDFVQGAFSFAIEEGDFFRSGRLPYGKATVLFRNKWALLPAT